MDLLIFLIPDPAILSISGPISDLNIGSVHPLTKLYLHWSGEQKVHVSPCAFYQGCEHWISIFKSAAVDHGGDYISDCIVYWWSRIKSLSCISCQQKKKKIFLITDNLHIIHYNTKIFTFEFLKDFNEAVTFLNDFVLPHLLSNPKVSQVTQGQLPHLFPWMSIRPYNAWVEMNETCYIYIYIYLIISAYSEWCQQHVSNWVKANKGQGNCSKKNRREEAQFCLHRLWIWSNDWSNWLS